MINTKIRHYKNVIEPIALYASKTVALNIEEQLGELKERKNERREKNCPQNIRLKKKRDINNKTKKPTEKHSNVENKKIRKGRAKFYGHIHRLPAITLTKEITT